MYWVKYTEQYNIGYSWQFILIGLIMQFGQLKLMQRIGERFILLQMMELNQRVIILLQNYGRKI